MIASAPGKLILLGEYAVLDPVRGGEALVVAVDRRAEAHVASGNPPPPSPFLARAEELLGPRLGPGAPIRVDTPTFRSTAGKLGLGSSAAATVAYVAARFAQSGVGLDHAQVHQIAHLAHAEVQAARGARGSGVDVTTSVHGGLLAVSTRGAGLPSIVRLPATGLHMVVAYSGLPASTTDLVAAVTAFAGRDPRAHARAIEAIARACRAGVDALAIGDAAAFITDLEAGGQALEALGAAAGVPLVTDTHREIARIAAAAGGAAKPTGAGGGDCAAAFFASKAAAGQFRGDLVSAGIEEVRTAIDWTGVAVFTDAAASSG